MRIHFFFQLAQLAVKPDQVNDDARKDGGNHGDNHPDFAVGPELIGHGDAFLNGLLQGGQYIREYTHWL